MLPTINSRNHTRRDSSARQRTAFTLVELLVVVLILMILAGVALPTIKQTLKDNKSAQAARQIVNYLREARSRAMASGAEVGVLIERLGTEDNFARSMAMDLRLSNAVPPYSGESPEARAVLFHDDNRGAAVVDSVNDTGATNAAYFRADESPLMYLAAQILNDGDDSNDHLSPIYLYDRLELQGGRSVVIRDLKAVQAGSSDGLGQGAKVNFDPRGTLYDARSNNSGATYSTVAFPSSVRTSNGPKSVTFKIHRTPAISSVGAHSMLRGMAIDLNYSGFGPAGVQLSPLAMGASGAGADCRPVGIVFAPDGSVSYMNFGVNVSGNIVRSFEHPTGNIFLCIGQTDGIRPDEIVLADGDPPANVMNPETIWVVINPFTGRVVASPAASVDPSQISANPTTDPVAAASEAAALSRRFAIQADTLDNI